VGYDREGRIAFGFYAGRTHAIVPMKDCLIGREGNALILDTVRVWMEKNHIEPYDEATGKFYKSGHVKVYYNNDYDWESFTSNADLEEFVRDLKRKCEECGNKLL
jgi:tRNA/tmRNA/rRNA uracil-C5-methylase (TrmA/RlmC/RlmD family)